MSAYAPRTLGFPALCGLTTGGRTGGRMGHELGIGWGRSNHIGGMRSNLFQRAVLWCFKAFLGLMVKLS